MAAPSPAQSHPELKHFLGPSLFSGPLLPPPSTMRSSIHFSANLPRVGFPCSAPTLTDPHACSLRNVFRASKISPQLAEAAPKGPGDLSSLLHFQTNPRAKVPPLSPTIRVEERNSASLDTILTVSGREENGAFDSKVTSATVNGLPTAETLDVRSSNDSLASPDFLAYTAEKLQPSTDTDTYNTSSSSAPGSLDSLSVLHQQLEKEGGSSELFTQGREDNKQEMSLLLEKLRETRKKGLQLIKKKLRESGQPNDWEEFSCAVDPESLIPGEYVVHKIKGIGRFVCINYEIPEGKNNPVKYVFLQYADGMAKLRAKQASRLLYRYYQPGEKGKAPSLSKLNDVRIWEKKKSKGRLAVQRMVVDLMQLYVHRLQQRRHPYTKDTEAMAKFTAKFPYKPTPDQEQAFLDVERDMTERDIPMDRLICGDVGFGKTEVALRAIFRVFAAGRQVMVLAPTTVLAKQHYEVIGDRFVGYDARVALLSRYQTSSEKKDLVARIKEGSLDIIVGTHSLLGRQIHYNNLGLLVVDEEQRFGVKQKERIASFKTSVDVLTLSATPIPRTLYLALTGFRDASLITTPPPERVPIITHLLEYQEEKMKAAIKFELARSGQVFYVFPRIRGLEDTKIALEGLFPGIKVGIAHGKQRGNILEETMERFAEGELDILLCTNIIESGLDIRRVNTIIVEDVHLFGLAQLYQLRGRVGRADKEAHAYLFHPDKEFLTDEALERLVALEECCGLGQGFQLAERDMAIRGFGSIFGEKQSGEVAHIGMDLFFEMLFESLSKAEHHTLPQLNYEEVKLDLEIDYHIPSDYIQDLDKRETVLHDLDVAASDGIKQLMHFTIKLRYEFGREPPSVEVLLKATYVKRMAADLGISHIWTRGKTIFMESNMSETSFEILKHSMTSDSLRSSLSFQNGQLELQALLELPSDRMLERILSCLADLRKGLPTFVKQW